MILVVTLSPDVSGRKVYPRMFEILRSPSRSLPLRPAQGRRDQNDFLSKARSTLNLATITTQGIVYAAGGCDKRGTRGIRLSHPQWNEFPLEVASLQRSGQAHIRLPTMLVDVEGTRKYRRRRREQYPL